MSTHPNAILLLVLTPDNASRMTHRGICSVMGVDLGDSSDYFKIGGEEYGHDVMEEDYNKNMQISAIVEINQGEGIYHGA